MKHTKILYMSICLSTFLLANENLKESEKLYTQSFSELLNTTTEQKAEVGSRSGSRDVLVSDVPIDIVTSEQLSASGFMSLPEVLEKYIPGFNYPRPSITDGTDHSKPFTLRGMNPDQVLVLINGKRLHQSSLLNVNSSIGRGTSSVDLSTIPIASIQRVEVLRDGAASQYGSDAIAGVINIILKGYGLENQLSVTYGKMKAGDGATKDISLFYSIPLEYDGFFNITAEYRDQEQTNRAGADKRDQYADGDPRNNLADPVNLHYGNPDAKDFLLALNSEIVSDSGGVYYLHGIYNNRKSEAGAYVRRPVDPRNNTTIYPDGFLPLIAPKIEDYSLSVGFKDVLDNDIKYDLSYTYGYNDYHFYVKNSLNHSLGDTSPTSFDSGGTTSRQNVINLDISKQYDSLFVGTGVEYRNENYKIYPGEEASYALGSASTIAGAQGFPGFQPSNEVEETRHNIGIYLDSNYKFDNSLILGVASRYEDYSDFGDNFNAKISATYKPIEKLLLRTNLSSGFRAPSLTQSYYTSTTSHIIFDDQVHQSGTFGVDNPVAQSLGAVPLKPEKSKHFTAGFIHQSNAGLSFSVDYFYTEIDDRIILSDNISESYSVEVKDILNNNGVTSARYFTNAISTKTDGVDLRLNYKTNFTNGSRLITQLSYHYDKTKITKINTAPSILGADGESIIIGEAARNTITMGQPQDNIKIYGRYEYKNYATTLNINRYGSYSSTLSGEVDHFSPKWITDLEVNYTFNKNFQLAIGAENLFDIYPDKFPDSSSPHVSASGILQYPQFSPFGFNGAFYYFRLGVSF